MELRKQIEAVALEAGKIIHEYNDTKDCYILCWIDIRSICWPLTREGTGIV